MKSFLIKLIIAAIASLGSVAVAQTVNNTESVEDTQFRRLKINLNVTSLDDIKVREGDNVTKGQVISDRDRERKRLVYQKKGINDAIANITNSPLIPPPEPSPVPQIKALPPANYAEQEAMVSAAQLEFMQAQRNYNSTITIDPYLAAQAATDRAKVRAEAAERELRLQQRKVDTIGSLDNLPREVLIHETEKLKRRSDEYEQELAEYRFKQSQLENVRQKRTAELQNLAATVEKKRAALELAQSRLRKAKSDRSLQEYEHSITRARRVEEDNQAKQIWARQQQEFAQQQRDREFKLSQLNQDSAIVEEKLEAIAVVRSPYDGKIKRIKTERQTDNTILVTISLVPN